MDFCLGITLVRGVSGSLGVISLVSKGWELLFNNLLLAIPTVSKTENDFACLLFTSFLLSNFLFGSFPYGWKFKGENLLNPFGSAISSLF